MEFKNASLKERKKFIFGIINVFNNSEKASTKEIMSFAPYVPENGIALPFLCKNTNEYEDDVTDIEYEEFMLDIDKNFYNKYFNKNKNFDKAFTTLIDLVKNGNNIAFDYLKFICEKYADTSENDRLIKKINEKLPQLESQIVSRESKLTKGDVSYLAYEMYFQIKKHVGIRSPSLV